MDTAERPSPTQSGPHRSDLERIRENVEAVRRQTEAIRDQAENARARAASNLTEHRILREHVTADRQASSRKP